MRSKNALALVLTAALVLDPLRVAHAAGPAAAQQSADDLKAQGDRLLTEKRYVEALDAYDRAYALKPNPALHFNRGRVLQFLARYPEALSYLERFEAEAPAELKAKVPGLEDLVRDVRSKVATLDLKSNVKGGRILVGGKDVGQTPMGAPLRVNAGPTVIEVIADGYLPFKKELTLEGNQTTSVDATLAPRDQLGFLLVKSNVAGSSVAVDGKAIGLAPAEASVGVGSHPIVVSHSGYDDAKTQIVLAAGERKELTLDPVKSTPITGKWWFWTIIGVVVVGGAAAATVIALTTERAPPSGDFSPGKVGF